MTTELTDLDIDALTEEEDPSPSSVEAQETNEEAPEPEEALTGVPRRVRDLQSKADRETARANRAERDKAAAEEALAAALAQTPVTSPDAEPDVTTQLTELQTLQRATLRNDIVRSDPVFAGVEDWVSGDTPDALRQSATRVRNLVLKIRTSERNRAMVEFGYNPDNGGGGGVSETSINDMDDEQFNRYLDRVTPRSIGVL